MPKLHYQGDKMKDLLLMIVEDEDNLRKMLTNALNPYFKELINAKNGDEGLKKFKKFKPDIVITDILMPIVDGLDMAKSIKEISKSTPIIVLSAFSEKEKLLKAIDIGIDKYLVKPVDIDELLSIINAIKDSKIGTLKLVQINENYQFDFTKKVLIKKGKEITLTKKELAFMTLLIENKGALVLHEHIKNAIWSNSKVTDTAIRTFIKRVRDKIGDDLIKNVPGLGYKIANFDI